MNLDNYKYDYYVKYENIRVEFYNFFVRNLSWIVEFIIKYNKNIISKLQNYWSIIKKVTDVFVIRIILLVKYLLHHNYYFYLLNSYCDHL
jgi:hypothetical protein